MGLNDRRFSNSKAWVDWLSDESVRKPAGPPSPPKFNEQALKKLGFTSYAFTNDDRVRTKHSQTLNTALKKPLNHLSSGDISINIHLPSIKLPKIRINWRRAIVWGGVGVVLLSFIFGTPKILQYFSSRSQTKTNKALSSAKAPSYAPLTPETVIKEGQVSGAQYDSKRQLYKYDDEYKGVSLTVSQQPLPNQLRENPAKIADIAKASINATEKIHSTNGDVYIVTDEKTGTQRLVLVHRQLLVFIQSYDHLENVDWLVYVQSLR